MLDKYFLLTVISYVYHPPNEMNKLQYKIVNWHSDITYKILFKK